MSRVVFVHGVAQQYRGPHTLWSTCAPALADGVSLAGGHLPTSDIAVAFYGDLFRPPGSRTTTLPDYDVTDLDHPLELALLQAWWQHAAQLEPSVPGPEDRTRARTPQWAQRALYALSKSRYFAGLADRVLIGNLKQVTAYLTNPAVRQAVQARVREAIGPDTSVLVGHSLGTVVGYELLCSQPTPSVAGFVTLGSPLGIPNLIFDRLTPPPANGHGTWPPGIQRWTNIADHADVVALAKNLAPLFGNRLIDITVHNGATAHDAAPYLTARETGHATRASLTATGR